MLKTLRSISDPTRLEWIAIAILTLVGLAFRLWPFGRLGLSHFDEGIYAMSGTWILEPGGLGAIEPELISYAPPGFTILIGLMYGLIGRSDIAAIAVSELTGTLTIPVVAWLARRIFGPGSGFAAAAIATFSGPQIAFSRMALTDASFLLTWLVAMAAGMRFLDRPTFRGGLALGLAVGIANLFKYNGWLSGALVILTALIGSASRAEERRPGHLLRIFGWGLVAIAIVVLLWLPWYRFVEAHGGYSELLRHQRSYLVGAEHWLDSFRTQANQTVALSGSRGLVLGTWIVAGAGGLLFRRWAEKKAGTGRPIGLLDLAIPILVGLVMVQIPNAAWWLGLVATPGLVASRVPSTRLVGVWWLALSILTPFYHPYARLWLPIHAVGWIILGGWLGQGVPVVWTYLRRLRGQATESDPTMLRFGLAWGWAVVVGVTWSIELDRVIEPARILPGLFDPSDSLRQATDQVVAILPKDVAALRTYGRPALTFYFGGRISTWPYHQAPALFRGQIGREWALLDQEALHERYWPVGIQRWEFLQEFPTELSLPTLLDISPEVATGRTNVAKSRSAPMTLFRPRISGGSP